MKKIISLLLIALCSIGSWAVELPKMPTAEDSIVFVNADFGWRDLGKGAQVGVAHLTLFGRPEVVSVIRYPMHKWHTSMVHAPQALSSTTDSIALRYDAAFAINGSYFNMRTFDPVTFFSVNHQMVGEQHPSTVKRSTGVVAVKGHRVTILKYDSMQVETYCKRYTSALQCGPLLMVDGQAEAFDVVSFNTVNHPRSFIGTTDDGWCYMVVVDGRLPGNAEGATMWELLAIARWLGCSSAMNLDGGGSSTLWSSQEGTINYPCDNKKYDHEGLRRVPNVLIVK